MSHPARSLWLTWPGLGEAILGLLLIALPLRTYSVYVNLIPVFSNSSLSLLEMLAYLVLTSTLSGILVVVLGIRRLLNVLRLGSVSGPATLLAVAKVLSEERYKRIMVAATLLYGLFFAVVSGTVVYRPMENFAQEYLIQAPSAVIAVCCGSTGLIPVLTVFLTNQLGLLVIPANILILAAVSALVGLNATLIVCEYHNRPRGASGRWLLGLGAFTGLFTACPTCAGLFFSALVVGLGSSALVILPSTQLYFVVGTILVLIGGVYLSTRMLGQAVLGHCEREQRRTP
ncbi:MAG: hypothetical protein ABSC50_01100 [Candidatus Bathyarchaeia archaeon]